MLRISKAENQDAGSGYVFFDVIWAVDKVCFITIARYLINSIAADGACVQVIQHFQLFVEIQLLVEQLNQLLETACSHIASRYPLCARVPRPGASRA